MSRDELLFIKGLCINQQLVYKTRIHKNIQNSLENRNNFTAKTECFSHNSPDPLGNPDNLVGNDQEC